MTLRNFAQAIIVHLTHEEKVAFASGIQTVPEDLADHWLVVASSEPVGDGVVAGEAAAPQVVEGGDPAALDAVTLELAAERAKVVALEANASEFDAAYTRLTGERDAARSEVEALTVEAAKAADTVAEVDALKATAVEAAAEIVRLTAALAAETEDREKAEVALKAATAKKAAAR